MKASVTLSISVVTVTESTGSRPKTTLGSKSCSTRGSGWRKRAVALSSVHTPITLLKDQKPRHIAAFWREPASGTYAGNSPGPIVALAGDPGEDPLGREHPGGPRTHGSGPLTARPEMRTCAAPDPHHCSRRRPGGQEDPERH